MQFAEELGRLGPREACIALASVACFVLFYFVWLVPRRFLSQFAAYNVKGRPFRPLLGELPEIIEGSKADDAFAVDRDSLAKYGPIWTTCFGPLPRLVLANHTFAYDVFAKNARCYEKALKHVTEPLLGKGLFQSEGDFWKSQRMLINPAFHYANLRNMIALMDECSELWFDRMSASIPRGGEAPMEVHKEMSGLALDIIASAAFGSAFRDRPEVTSAVYEAFTDTLEEIQNRNMSFIGFAPYLNRIPTPGLQRIQTSTRRIQGIVMKIVEDRRAQRNTALVEGKDLLDLLLDARDTATGQGMPEQQIRDESMTFVLAGHEATANLLAWTLWKMSSDDNLWAEIKAEVDSVMGDRPVDIDSLKQLKLMDGVLSEALRLYPVVPYLRRVAVKDNYIGEGEKRVLVPAGTLVSLNVYLLHRDPAVWGADAEEFNAKRWLDSARLPKCSYMPFGGGPRICIGQVILCSFVRRFTMTLVPGQKIVPDLNVTMRPKYGVNGVITPLQS